jgi:hypothetical protein
VSSSRNHKYRATSPPSHAGGYFRELYRRRNHEEIRECGKRPELSFYRDDSKIEVDLLDYTDRSKPQLIEIKSSETYRSRFAQHLSTVGSLLNIPAEQQSVIYRGTESFTSHGINIVSAAKYLT